MSRFRLSAALAVVLAAPAWAETATAVGAAEAGSDEAITVTATRAPAQVDEVPVTVTVIDDEQIADELATDIKDLVRFEPGVSVQRQPARFGAALGTTGRAGNDGFNIRGIGGNRVLIQVDGVRVPDGYLFGAQSVGRGDYVDVGLVKSVEILRGPVSALYGSDGLAGAVSFITTDPADIIRPGKSVGGLLRASFSSDDSEFAETAILAGKTGVLSAMLAYTRRDFEELGNQGSKGINGGIGPTRTLPNPQDGRSDAFLGRLVLEPGGNHKLRLTGEYLDTRLDTDVLSGRGPGLIGVVDSLEGHDTGFRKRIAADWSWTGQGTIQAARAAVYWQDAEDKQFTEEFRTGASDRTRLNTFENRVYGAAADGRAGFETGSVKHTMVFGGDISFTRQSGKRDGTVPPAGETYPTRNFPLTDYVLAGLFVGDEIDIGDGKLMLYPALRWDLFDLDASDDPLLPLYPEVDQDGSRLSPKFGAVFRVTDNVRLVANYAQGFKAPAPSQVNQFFENLFSPTQSYRTIGNPDLGPETSESLEAGIRVSTDFVSGSLTAFTADYDDFIVMDVIGGSGTPADPFLNQFININKVKVDGVEGRVEFDLPLGFNARVSAAYARGKTYSPGLPDGRLATIDPLTVVASVGYREPVADRYGAQLMMTHHSQKGSQAATNIGLSCSGTGCYRPGAAFIADFMAHFRIAEMITLRGAVFNIFDNKYALWSDAQGVGNASTAKDAFTRPGRNYSASLSFGF